MNQPRVIKADYASWRPVAGRKVLQLVFEVPIEQTADVMTMLGVPMPGESKWCAVALLDSPVAQRIEHPVPNREAAGSTPAGATKEHKKFAEMPLSQQAAIRCQDNDFKLFLDASNAEHAAEIVRANCAVETRSEFDRDPQAGAAWGNIEARYQQWLTDRKYAQVAR